MTQANWLEDKIDNLNYLAPQGFKLTIEKFPKVAYLCQSANIPGIRIPDINVATPFRDIPIAGTETEYEDLVVRFLIDENMENYVSIHKWIAKTGLAEKFDSDEDPEEGWVSLEILNSNFNSNVQIEFENAWPTALTPVSFDATETGVQYLTATATFKYSIYRIKYDGVVIS